MSVSSGSRHSGPTREEPLLFCLLINAELAPRGQLARKRNCPPSLSRVDMSSASEHDLKQVKRASARDAPERRQNPVQILFVHRSVADVERCLYELRRVRFTVNPDVVFTPNQFTRPARPHLFYLIV